jgi:hypothetical protein
MNNYEWLVARLDAFIRKYYLNKVVRGGLVFLSCLLFYFLTFSVSEYYLYLPVWLRLIIVSAFVLLGLSALVAWVIIPLAKMGRLGKLISHDQAAGIIGTHFPEISDRLLNILQLKRQTDNYASRELAEASINQRISRISVVPITKAIDLSKNKKYLPYLLPLLLIGVFILVAAPNVFKEGSSRLLQPTRAFEKPAPFQFIIKNTSLIAVRNADFVLTVETKGNTLPAEAYIEAGDERVPMQPLGDHSFQYTFKNVTGPVNFRFYGAGFYSSANVLKVIQKPVLKAFKVHINYPAYTAKKEETRNSLSDMTLPVGTTVHWDFTTDHTDAATIHFGNGAPADLHQSGDGFDYSYRFLSDTAYTITLRNKEAFASDSFRYQVQVIPDQFPVIQLQQFKDTVSGKEVLLTGTAGDDYGITRVSFNYEVSDKNKMVASKSIPVRITPGALTPFEQYFDIQSLNLQPGQKLSYYIEAWDNDGVHGSKSARSEVMTYFMYNEKQVDSAINENSRQINSGISSSAEKTQQLQSEYKEMQSKMMESNNLDWQQQQSLQEMMKKQMELKTQLENTKQRFEEQMQQTDQKKLSDNLKDKQQEMDKQLDNLLNQELKDEMKKLQDLMQQLNKDKAVDAMQKMEQENKLFKMDMQRMQELMKKLEMQMHMEQMANKLDELAKKERDLENKTEKADPAADKSQKDADKDGLAAKDNKDKNGDKKDGADSKGQKDSDKKGSDAQSKDQKEGGKKSDEELSKEQKDLKDQLDKAMKEELKEAQKLAKDTRQSDRMEDEEKQGQDAGGDMQDSKDQLDQKQNSKASKSQKKAADKMESMAKAMRKKAGDMDMEQVQIDIKATRQLLSNLIRLSFGQEDLMDSVRHTSPSTQAYINNQETQNRLHSNSLMIRDSLFELSKRIEKLPVIVNKETTEMEQNMKRAVDDLENRNQGGALSEQQYVMTHANNLALMLNEILTNLMNMQNEGKPSEDEGEGACAKPGTKPGSGKKPGKGPGQQLSDIITQQQQLGESMQKMQGGQKPGGKQGQKPGQGQNGQSQGQQGQGKDGNSQGQQGQGQNANGEYGDARQLAMLAAQQAKIRREIQELTSLLNSKGLGNSKEMQDIQQKMDKTETDLVNRHMSSDLMLRQKDIETRMLEAEKSLREQEQDDKRASNSGKDAGRPTPPALEKYILAQRQLLELYKTVPPQLKPYYREMVENYFHIIGNK